MRYSNIHFLVLIAAIVLISALPGCVPMPGPLPQIEPDDLMARMTHTPGANTLQASGIIQLNSPESSYNANLLLFYRAPDSVKMVIQVGFGTTLAELLLTGATGVAYFPHQRQAFSLNAGSAIDIGSVTVYPSIVTSLLKPFEPTISEIPDSIRVTGHTGFYYLTQYCQGSIRTWKVEGRSHCLDTEDFTTIEDNIQWQRSFRVIRRQLAPENIIVQFSGATTTLYLRRIDVSPNWDHSPFNIRLPDDVHILDLSH